MCFKNNIVIFIIAFCIFASCQQTGKKLKSTDDNLHSSENTQNNSAVTPIKNKLYTEKDFEQKQEDTPTQNNQYTIKGIEQINDGKLVKSVLNYCKFMEEENYKEVYNYISEHFLKNILPKIKTAEQYKNFMMDNSEIENLKFLKILHINYTNDNSVQIEIVDESISEGDYTKVKSIYSFVKEGNVWKFDGVDPESLKTNSD
jgi:DNA-binding transcriptional MerR regulator